MIDVGEIGSGLGGFRKALENIGGFNFVWSCDFDKWANRVYLKHWPKSDHHPADVRGVDPEEIPDFDLLCSGFPCQPFSNAGKRQGFEDTRGTIFFEILRIAAVKKPKMLFLENVEGMLYHDSGNTFETICRSLNEVGYIVDFNCLNSRFYGVPQDRNRVFIIGMNVRCLLEDIHKKRSNLSKIIIEGYLLEKLLKKLEDQKRGSVTKLKGWGLVYLILNEVSGQLKNSISLNSMPTFLMKKFQGKLTERYQQSALSAADLDYLNAGDSKMEMSTSTLMDTTKLKQVGVDASIISLLKKENWEGKSLKLKRSTTLTLIKQIIEKKTYSYAEIEAIILLSIFRQWDYWENWLIKTSLNLTKRRDAIIYEKRGEKNRFKQTNNLRFHAHTVDSTPKQHTKISRYLRDGGLRQILPILEDDRVSDEIREDKKLVSIAQSLRGRDWRGNFVIAPENAATLTAGGHSAGLNSYMTLILDPFNKRIRGDGVAGALKTANSAGSTGTVVAITATNPRESGGERVWRFTDIARTLTQPWGNQHTIIVDWLTGKLRRLTPREEERLQGLPDDWTLRGVNEKGKDVKMSDSQRYRLLGQAVTVNVVEVIGRHIKAAFEA